MKQQMSEFDLFYISYDEPKCEENWADLLEKAPWAQRIHGVKGFDSAHKACAMASTTDRFITVDGDNIIDETFLDLEITIPEKYKDCALSWNSVNEINGLVYGNGGLKLWTRDWVMNMKTHENAVTAEEKLDFCWDRSYLQLNSVYSITRPNGSAFQAFRAGFREGCKMTLDQGGKVDRVKMQTVIHDANLRRLLVWACVGRDVPNGLAAIYGTRLGIYKTNIEEGFDIGQISDYDWFKNFGETELTRLTGDSRLDTERLLVEESHELGLKIKKHMALDLCLFHHKESAFFKSINMHQPLKYSVDLEKEFGL
jgi:hypothetical protein